MATIITMPAVVADATEAVLQAWLVAEGDTISKGTALADIETEKATVEFESEVAGTIGKLIAQPGAKVQVGEPVAIVLGEGEGAAELDAALGEAGGAAAAEAPTASSEGGTPEAAPADTAEATPGDVDEKAPDATPDAPAVAPAQAESAAAPAETEPATGGERRFSSPLARKTAREAGVQLESVEGTGPGGRIVRADVERAIAAGATAPATAAPEPAQATASGAAPTPTAASSEVKPPREGAVYEDTPMSGMRRAIARRLTESKTQVPHFYVTRSVEMDALLALRKDINATVPEGGRRISVNDLVIKAVALALRDVPAANRILAGDAIRSFETVDISVAIAIPDGLLTPVIRDADTIGIGAISRKMADFVERAQAGRIKQNELEGGAFSISNLGMYGVEDFSAILNPPQAGILAVSAAQQRPVVRDGELAIATLMTCTLSADHRVIDGAVGAEFMAAFAARIESPLGLLVG